MKENYLTLAAHEEEVSQAEGLSVVKQHSGGVGIEQLLEEAAIILGIPY